MFKFIKERFSKIKKALSKTSNALSTKLKVLFKGPWTEEQFDELERILYEADLGSACSIELVEATRKFIKQKKDATLEDVLSHLRHHSLQILQQGAKVTSKVPEPNTPKVILIVGVNGSGKTTSVAKLGHSLKQEGHSVLLAAADTFRAAATEQLASWGEKLGIPVIRSEHGADPAAVAFDALTAAKSRGCDTILIDTAGRLQNKTDLMHQLGKILKVIQKQIPDAPHETLLVIDATTGQNGIDQAKVFHSFTPLTGILLSKLDGSAKGGVVLSIYKSLGIPVQWIGVGEQMDDLIPFNKEEYLDALFTE